MGFDSSAPIVVAWIRNHNGLASTRIESNCFREAQLSHVVAVVAGTLQHERAVCSQERNSLQASIRASYIRGWLHPAGRNEDTYTFKHLRSYLNQVQVRCWWIVFSAHCFPERAKKHDSLSTIWPRSDSA